MPVRETLDFSGRCLGVGTRHDLLVELTRQEKRAGIQPDPVIDAFMKATSMEHQETSLITDYALKVFSSVISILLRSSDRSISLPIHCYSWKNRSGGKYTWYLYNATCFLTWRVHYRQRSNSVSDEDQPRVEKLSLKKKAIGSEARAERMANAERGRW